MENQLTGTFWAGFGEILAVLFAFGILYAFLNDYLRRKGINNQTVWLVVGGVLVVVLVWGLWYGNIVAPLTLLAGFSAAGLPMIIWYIAVVENDARSARRTSHEDLSNDHRTTP